MKKLITLLFSILLLFSFTACDDNSTSADHSQNGEQDPEDLEYELVWYDEFDGNELDTDKWSYQIGTGTEYGLDAWGNNELQYYTSREDNIFVSDGMLHIVAKEENYNNAEYTSARIRTFDKGDWWFGRIEIKAKLPEGQGIWPALWMLPTDEVFGGWPKSGEIDIMELVGHEPNAVHGTVHYGPDWPENRWQGDSYTLSGGEKFSDDFNVFSIEWVRNEITWFVNGEKYHTITPESLHPHPYPFNHRFHLLINIAVGGDWPGNPDSTTEFPQTMYVDYVRVYQLQ